MCWERVVTITDFYDGPTDGVAFFDGKPHAYQRLFDYAEDEYSDEYDLMPIDEALLPLIEEQWSIWIRWATAFHAGETPLDTHPALSEDRHRYDELKATLDPLLVVDSKKPVRRFAEFRYIDIIGWEHDAEVRWSLPARKE
jgi:hypothetical protein